jgi:glutathione synthase/RimK-type ligase-like ATP-grasp enzyme
MTDHPITPPPEMVEQWRREPEYADGTKPKTMVMMTADRLMLLSEKSAQYGADQELEACVEWFQEFYKTESWVKHDLKHFRAARRPKLPSLKEQALKALREAESSGCLHVNGRSDTIRRALEQLNG